MGSGPGSRARRPGWVAEFVGSAPTLVAIAVAVAIAIGVVYRMGTENDAIR